MWMATMWRSNTVMCVTVPYNKILLSILYFFLTSQSEADFGIALVYTHSPWAGQVDIYTCTREGQL